MLVVWLLLYFALNAKSERGHVKGVEMASGVVTFLFINGSGGRLP